MFIVNFFFCHELKENDDKLIDVPSKPDIKNASLSKKGLFIEWTLENTGGADLTKAIIELSPDFDNQSITVQGKDHFIG